MYDDKGIAKLSQLLNSAVRTCSGNRAGKKEAYANTIKLLESTMLETEKKPRDLQKQLERLEKSQKDESSIPRRQSENTELSQKVEEKKKTKKKRMKWNEYLEIQVAKQRKINEELETTLKKKIKEKGEGEVKHISFQKKIDIKELDKDLRRFKPVVIKDNFKKLDEQECFFEDGESPPELIKELPLLIPEKEEADIVLLEANAEKDNDETIEELKTQEILQRYEKTIGKLKSPSIKAPTPNLNSCRSPSIFDRRSKSSHSNYSTESHQNAYLKLKHLQEEEVKIHQQKQELIKFLESRSQIKGSSRPTTVASLYNKHETEYTPVKIIKKAILPEILPSKRENLRTAINKSRAVHARRSSNSEVKDLISNLF